jgi:O-antigen/teichoic acid export membrane protein
MRSIYQVFLFDLLAKALLVVPATGTIRYLSEGEYAKYTIALSFAGFFSQTLASSFNIVYIVGDKEGISEPSPSAFLGFQVLVVGFIGIMLLPAGIADLGVYGLVFSLVLATTLSEFSKTFYQKKLKFLRYSAIELARTGTFVICFVLLVAFIGRGLAAWHILTLQAWTMTAVFLAFFYSKLRSFELMNVSGAWEFAQRIWKGKQRYLLGYFSLLALFSQLDVFILRARSSDIELASYGSALRYYMFLLLALGAVHAVLLPTMSRKIDVEELYRVIRQYRHALLLIVPTILFGAWSSQWIIPWIDQGKYPAAVLLFRILSFSAIVSFIFSPYVSLVLRFEEYPFLFRVVLFGLLLSATMNYTLIGRYGATGAAISNLFSYGIVNGLFYRRANCLLNDLRKNSRRIE